MKKAIIILTILSILTIGLGVYKGYYFIQSINTLNERVTTKNELIETNIELEKENIKLNEEYNKKSKDLLDNNKGCELWAKQDEVLKKTKE